MRQINGTSYVAECNTGGYTGKIVDSEGNTVAVVNNYDTALVMASAPELLEALKRFVDVCDNGTPIDIFNALGDCVEPARQAITKAKGETP